MKIQVVAVLILALSAAEISEALNFFQKHVVTSRNPPSCDTKMKEINAPNKWCKPLNTVFLDPKRVLTGICNFGNYRQTQDIDLQIIDCKIFKKSNRYPHCKYRAVKGRATSLTVLCNQNHVSKHLDACSVL
uniref:Ribonuclease A-domain domain-containing protein n=1 Tax=Poecilia reticulata TaxID=8081 RepID=A0A3P9NBZ6_POERE